ncbi:sugar phosphate isomerase/epimerase family protein [Actinomyces howellii]|uniref:Xylose isomerase-like TIM barrel n=1 Tax=Actinomyces howellii TaxID=52771 RepID=A0A3S4RBT7_9ACTO|nr:TIM barrel protein [Actinomyces howellii]VEG29288.1 Xylose isomerase-like TIM barrel [Actinomyces howellii]
MTSQIKRGVSLYSYQHEYAHGQFTVEDAVAAAAAVGALGIETLGEQMFPGFPFPGQPDLPDSFYDRWRDLMDGYGTTPTVHDMFLDTKRYKDRLLNLDEMVQSLQRDIRHTARLGAKGIRVIVNTPPEVVEAAAPYAADHGVWMGVEIHSPYSFEDDWIKRHLEVAERVGSDVVGCVPDMGIFVHRLPRVVVERALRDGADPELVQEIVETYNAHGDTQAMFERVERIEGIDPFTLGLARTGVHMIAQPVDTLRGHAELIRHIHAKFYEMHPVEGFDYWHEYSIPYHEIVPVLEEIGYDGYLSSEYEGNRHIEDAEPVDSVTQVAQHQKMLAALIGEEN